MFCALYIRPNSSDDWSDAEGSPFEGYVLEEGKDGFVMCTTGKYGTIISNFTPIPNVLYKLDQLNNNISLFTESLSTALGSDVEARVDGGLAKSGDFVFKLENATKVVKGSLLVGRRVSLQIDLTSDEPTSHTENINFNGRIVRASPERESLSFICRGYLQKVKDRILGEVQNEGEDSVYKAGVAPISYGSLVDSSSFAPLILEREGVTFKFSAGKSNANIQELVLYDEQNDITFPLVSEFEVDSDGYIRFTDVSLLYLETAVGESATELRIWAPDTVGFEIPELDPNDHGLKEHTKFTRGSLYRQGDKSFEFLYYKDGFFIFTVRRTSDMPDLDGNLTKLGGDGPGSLTYTFRTDFIRSRHRLDREQYISHSNITSSAGIASAKSDPVVFTVGEEEFLVLDSGGHTSHEIGSGSGRRIYRATRFHVKRGYSGTEVSSHSRRQDVFTRSERNPTWVFKHEIYPSDVNVIRSMEITNTNGLGLATYSEEAKNNITKRGTDNNLPRHRLGVDDTIEIKKISNLLTMGRNGWNIGNNNLKWNDTSLDVEDDSFELTKTLHSDGSESFKDVGCFLLELDFLRINMDSDIVDILPIGCYDVRADFLKEGNVESDEAVVEASIGYLRGGQEQFVFNFEWGDTFRSPANNRLYFISNINSDFRTTNSSIDDYSNEEWYWDWDDSSKPLNFFRRRVPIRNEDYDRIRNNFRIRGERFSISSTSPWFSAGPEPHFYPNLMNPNYCGFYKESPEFIFPSNLPNEMKDRLLVMDNAYAFRYQTPASFLAYGGSASCRFEGLLYKVNEDNTDFIYKVVLYGSIPETHSWYPFIGSWKYDGEYEDGSYSSLVYKREVNGSEMYMMKDITFGRFTITDDREPASIPDEGYFWNDNVDAIGYGVWLPGDLAPFYPTGSLTGSLLRDPVDPIAKEHILRYPFNNVVRKFKTLEYNSDIYNAQKTTEGVYYISERDPNVFSFQDQRRVQVINDYVNLAYNILDIGELSQFAQRRINLALFYSAYAPLGAECEGEVKFKVAAPGFLVYFRTDPTKNRLWWRGEGKVDGEGNVIEHPVDIIRDLLTNELGVEADRIVEESFDLCKFRRQGWKFAFYIFESAQRSSLFLEKILRQAGLTLSETGEGKLYLSDMIPPETSFGLRNISSTVLDSNDVSDWKEEFTGTGRLATDFLVRYKFNNLNATYAEHFESESVEAHQILDEERKVYLDLDLVKDAYTAREITTLKQIYNRSSIRKLTLRCPMEYKDYNVGEWVTITDPYVTDTEGKVYKIIQNNVRPGYRTTDPYLEIKCFEHNVYVPAIPIRITEEGDFGRVIEDGEHGRRTE